MCQENFAYPSLHVNTSSMGISYRNTYLKASNQRTERQEKRSNLGIETENKPSEWESDSDLTYGFSAVC